MNPLQFLFRTPNRRIAVLAMLVLGLDQFTKGIILRSIGYGDEIVVIPGFFKFVHLVNTGAAWSMFTGNNGVLTLIAIAAIVVLFLARNHFNSSTGVGQLAFGLIFGGILGNLVDRIFRQHVIDFLYFYLRQSSGRELAFPAFNVADSAICIGVGLVFIITWKTENTTKPAGTN